ncbi:MAG: SDR family NAD(P)-dependent oxidoreductase [Rubrivivax sp.]|nr:SDR family NAD(P)-dependent oxidoreductase [Rubrivivax sp.]
MATRQPDSDPARAVAIVGIGCRFPGGVVDPQGLWQLLSQGRDAVGEIPPERIDLARYFDPRPATPGHMSTRWGGYLERLEEFDAGFFGIAPLEAERMDPAQRLVLETAWEGLEDAQVDTATLDGSRTGVFIGQWLSDFEGRLFSDPDTVDFYMTTGSGRYATSGRLSYLLGLRGPSFTVDTACSSSLVAVHQAVRSLREGECTLALAGGVNVILQPHIHIAYSQSRMMATDGRCKFGDARGDGYVRSEGAAMLVLKPLAAARADGDRIYAVIRGSAVNNDGRSSGSMGTPSRTGQAELLRTAYTDARIDPAEVGCIEAHGTGTRAGDPVELGALADVLGPGRAEGRRAWVGSVKTNLGHTEGAAGVAGLVKLALAIHHRVVPASLHCRDLNPAIAWDAAPFALARQAQRWEAAHRIGGVSAFGIAGTNAHIVLSDAGPPATAPAADSPASLPEPPHHRGLQPAPHLLVLSAQGPEALRELAARHAERLATLAALPAGDAEPALRNHLHAAATRRTALRERAVFVVDSGAQAAAQLAQRLAAFAQGEAATAQGRSSGAARPKVAFIVPGQGAQWAGMARELLQRAPAFRQALQECDRAAQPWLGESLVRQLELDEGASGWRLDQIDVIQPALVALAIAYARWLQSMGVQPDAVVGHSMGEVGAACIAGALSIEQAMRIVCRRSALMRRTSGQGAMALVELSTDDAQARIAGLEDRLAVAVSNSPRSSVISGDPQAVQSVMQALERDQIFCRLVKVDVASHSPQMQPLADELQAELADLVPSAPAIPMVSTVRARAVAGAELDATYWAANLRQRVRFTEAVRALLEDGIGCFVELGPHPVLLPAVQQTAQALAPDAEVACVACGRRNEAEAVNLVAAVGSLWTHGLKPDWTALYGGAHAFTELPRTPWQRERLWVRAAELQAAGPARQRPGATRSAPSTPRHAILPAPLELGGDPPAHVWDVQMRPAWHPHLAEHRLHGSAVLAASVFVELAAAAARSLQPRADGTVSALSAEPVRLSSLAFSQALYLNADGATAVQLRAEPTTAGHRLVAYSEGPAGWVQHFGATLGAATEDRRPASRATAPLAPPALPQTGAQLYSLLQSQGVQFGGVLQALGEIRVRGDAVEAELHAPAGGDAGGPWCVAPWALDACFQLAAGLLAGQALWMPVGADHVELRPHSKATQTPSRVRLRPRASEGAQEVMDLELLADAEPVLSMRGLRLARLDAAASARPQPLLWQLHWPIQAAPAAAVGSAARACVVVADGGPLTSALTSQLAGSSAVLTSDANAMQWQAALHAAAASAGAAGIDIVLLATTLAQPAVAATRPPGTETLPPMAVGTAPDAAALMPFLQALQRAAAFDAVPRRCWLVTRGAQVVAGADGARLAPGQSALAGLLRTAASEWPTLWGGSIDLDPETDLATQAAAVVQTLAGGAPADAAWRAGQRHVARLRSAPASTSAAAAWQLPSDRSVLVTGGLGGVGFALAQWLVERGARHLLVLGRTPLPPRAVWSRTAPGTATAKAQGQVRQLEAMGASVHHRALDVADGAALARCLADFASEQRPPIGSVFHAAGVTDDRLLQDLDAASIDTVMLGKVQGAWHLDRLLPELDHFVLFSSVAALLPQPGQASYAAANAALDALAHRRRAAGQAALSVNWGVWQGLGFAATAGGEQALAALARSGLGAFSASQGLQVLQRLLAERAPASGRSGGSGGSEGTPPPGDSWAVPITTQAAVLPLERQRLADAAAQDILPAHAAALLHELAQPPAAKEGPTSNDDATGQAAGSREGGAGLLAQLRRASSEQRPALLRQRLAQLASRVLGLPAARLDARTPLGSYGLNSLMALELRNGIERDLQLPLSATVLWNYPTLTTLADHLLARAMPAQPMAEVGGPSAESIGAPGPAPVATPPAKAVASTASRATTPAAQASQEAADKVAEVAAMSDAEALAALTQRKRASRGGPR